MFLRSLKVFQNILGVPEWFWEVQAASDGALRVSREF